MTPPCKRGMRSRVARLPASSNCAYFPAPNFGGIAQLVERLVRNEKARGSNPLTSKNSSFDEFP